MIDESAEIVQWDCDVTDEAATQDLASRFADAAVPGLVMALEGPLGAGKTRFVQAFAAQLGIDRAEVTSPTFVLIQEYLGQLAVYHFDAYRLRDEDEFLELGAEELFSAGGVCLIEWASRVSGALPSDLLTIDFEITGPLSRRVHVTGRGGKGAAVAAAVKTA